jgi:subtilisin family serine protease
MRRTMLRLVAPVFPSILCALGLAFDADRPAHAQGLSLPGGLSPGGFGRMGPSRGDNGPRSFSAPRGFRGGAMRGRAIDDADEDEDDRRRRRRGQGLDRFVPKSGDLDPRGDRGGKLGRLPRSDREAGGDSRNPRPDRNIPGSSGKRATGGDPKDSRPDGRPNNPGPKGTADCRNSRLGCGKPDRGDPKPDGGTHGDAGCRARGTCGQPTPTDNPSDPNCRRGRGKCDGPTSDPPRRPPVIIVTPIPPLLPEPPVYNPPSYTPPPRPTPVYEPASPSRPALPPRRVDRTPPAPPPAALPPAADTPVPPRRDFTLAPQPQYRPNEVLVTIQGAQPDAVAGQLAQSFNLVIQESQGFALLDNRRVYRFSIPDNRTVETVVAAVASQPGVAQTSPNFYHYLQGGSGGGALLSMQYALPKLRVPDTQDLVSGRGITIAVIDSGVDVNHPAFKGVNITFYDVVDSGVKDPDQHGTAIAGIIAGRGETSGIAPNSKILAMRAFAPERLGAPARTTSMALCRATDVAFAKGARVFNMSFAGPRDPLLLELIDSGHEKGAVFIAAAGNAGPKAPPAFPAAYEKVIGITATDEKDGLYEMANRGSYVSAAAPGVDILVPVVGKSLDYMSGTSFAAAHITGIVALLMERNTSLRPEDVRRILVEAAHDLGEAGHDEDFGAGLADAYRALLMASPKQQSSINP